MIKIRLIGLMITVFCSSYLMAQNTVTGTVRDGSGTPLVGVTVLEKGATNGSITDIDGRYSLNVSSPDATLAFTFVGFATQEIPLNGRTTIDIGLNEEATELGEVVISALGFKEKRDNISSTYSRVDGDKVVQKGENKVIDGLGGKMAGVKIGATSGDPGAGANILIRGQSTIQGETQPLIIVDGVPLNNDFTRGLASEAGSSAGVNQQSRLNDINPDDIASMQVYKGASAGALYGSRGINGVIVITTKRGQAGKAKITYTAGLTIDEVSRKHPLQTTFGQGTGGVWRQDNQIAWGDKISERSGGADEVDLAGERFVSYLDGTTYYRVTSRNDRSVFVDSNFDQAFQTAYSWDHKVSMSGGNDETTYYFSLGKVDQEGIIRNATYDKINFTAAMTQQLNDRLKLDYKANFVNIQSNRIQTGSNTSGLYLSLLRTPPDFDNTHYIGDYVNAGGIVTPSRHRAYRESLGDDNNPSYNNPGWTINELSNTSNVNRFIGSAQIEYKLNDNINLIARTGGDTYTDNRVYFFPYFSAGSLNGELENEAITVFDYTAEFLANFNYDITSSISTNTTIGWGLNSRSRKIDYSGAINFTENFRKPLDVNELTSLENIQAEISRRDIRYTRVFGSSSFSYEDQLFLTMGGAFEKHSSYIDGFFYPSLELGWVASKTVDLPGFISFGKLRLAYGQVGNAPRPHRDLTLYEVGSFSSFSDAVDLAFFPGGGYQLNERLGNPNLQPEIKTETEFGVDLRFLQNRLWFSMTAYKNDVKDVLLDVTLTPSLGYTEQYANAADIENKGLEIEAGYKILDQQDFTLGVNLNYSRNRNKVINTEGSVIDLVSGSSVRSVAIEGQPMGVFYTQGFLRDADGNMVFNNGFPVLDQSGDQVLGDPSPDWRGGMGIEASYKDWRFNMLFETSQGNDVSARTEVILEFFGTHANTANEVTLTEDMVTFLGNTIPAGTTVRGNLRDFGGGTVLLEEDWYRNAQGFGDGKFNNLAVRDGSWTRLREASISYTLRRGLPKGINDIEFTAAGRNLIIWTDVVGIDPDVNQFGPGYGFGLDYFTNPGARSYIFTLKATF